jgi:signal peptidase II
MQTTRGTSLTESDQPAHRRPAAHATHRLTLVLFVAAIVIAADVVSKLLVVAKLSDRAPIRLLGGVVKLEETRNPGAAFSIGTGTTIVFAVVAIAVIVVILRTARRLASLPWAIVLGLLLGGATGNLIDRLARSPGAFRGWVVDWISVPHFAVFNLADSAITIGAVLAVLLALTGRQFDGSVHRAGPKASTATAADASRVPADEAEQ